MADEKKTNEETVEETPVEETPAAEETPVVEESTPEAPAADAETAPEPVAEEAPAAPVQQSGPKPKRKRLPRSLRRKRTKAPRNPSGERKPIVRLEKPEHERGRRQERQGTVVSAVQDKTIVVQVATIKAHPRYKKVVRRSQRFHAHDEANVAKVGDIVRIVETRPVSKLKHWRLTEVVEEAK
jgi:small subunit ribosomal protein S17